MPAAQVVQEALPSAEKDPGEQARQIAAVFAGFALCVRYVPAAQVSQEAFVAPVAPPIRARNLPASQPWQAPPEAAYSPSKQAVHEILPSAEDCPARQRVQVAAPGALLNLPTGHICRGSSTNMQQQGQSAAAGGGHR